MTHSGSNSLEKVITDCICLLCWIRFTADLYYRICEDLVVITLLFSEHHLMVYNNYIDIVLGFFLLNITIGGVVLDGWRDCKSELRIR